MPKNRKEKKKNGRKGEKITISNLEIADDDGSDQKPKGLLNWLYYASIEYFVHWRRHVKEYAFVILLMLALRSCVGVVYRIPSGSMIPTFREGDTLLANRFYYGLKIPFTDGLSGYRLPAVRSVESGDIIIFRAPPEEVFYDVVVPLKESDKLFFKNINQASSFKRPLSAVGRNSVLRSFLGDVNYVVMDTVDDSVMLHLHEKIWKQYREELEKLGAKTISSTKTLLNYQNSGYDGLLYELLKTPLSGFSILGQAIIDLPFFMPYSLLGGFLYPEVFVNGKLSIYPNSFVDTTKEFVKRVIAVEGDVVEIKKRVVHVNGQPLVHSTETLTDPYDDYFYIGKEEMPNSRKNKNSESQAFTHPVRFGRDMLHPFLQFDKKLWPYEPSSFSAINFRDDFGPVEVPEGHYFVMGDNRDESQDSRFIGMVPKWAVKGTPMFIFFPFSRAGLVK